MQPLAAHSSSCRIGVTAASVPSTSGRPASSGPAPPYRQRHAGAQQQARQRRDCSVGITNTQAELIAAGLHDAADDEYLEINRIQVPNPELGPLEQRVEATYEEAMFTEEISPADTQYWFTAPEEGWNSEPERVPKAPLLENAMPTALNPGEGRTPLDGLREGAEMTGVVTRLMLHHGAQVDLGAEYDGLIPILLEEWLDEVQEAVFIDTEVRVRIHKIRDISLYRWPVQLELLSPAHAADLLPPPEAHRPTLDLRGRDNIESLVEETGRPYHVRRYWTEMGDQGFDCDEEAEEEGTTPRELWDPSVLHRISELGASF
jgi:hypothetical protein